MYALEYLYMASRNVECLNCWKTIWRLLKKLSIELPYDLASQFPDAYPNKLKIAFKQIHAYSCSSQSYSQQKNSPDVHQQKN